MTGIQPFELSLFTAAILVIVEVVTGSFIFLSFGLGCVAAGILQAWSGTFSLFRDASVFAAVSIGGIVVLRLVFGHARDSRRAEGDVNEY